MRVSILPYMIIDGKKYFLLCEEGISGKLNIIGGQLNIGETPEEGAVREAFEETIGLLNLSPHMLKSLPDNKIKITKNEIIYFISINPQSKKAMKIPEEYKLRREQLSKIPMGVKIKLKGNLNIVRDPIYEELNGLYWISEIEIEKISKMNDRVPRAYRWMKKTSF